MSDDLKTDKSNYKILQIKIKFLPLPSLQTKVLKTSFLKFIFDQYKEDE